MDLQKSNWYGLNHKEVFKRFNVQKYIGTFCVLGEYSPVSVYYSENPDRTKNHKNYLMLQIIDKQILIRGMDKEQIESFAKVAGVYCPDCKQVIYSTMRHDYNSCKCESISIDGGSDYTKVSYDSNKSIPLRVTINLLTDEITI